MPSKLNNAVTDNVVTDKPTTTWFFVYNYSKVTVSGTGNFMSELTGYPTFNDIQFLEKDISERLYKGEASVVITNFIKLGGE